MGSVLDLNDSHTDRISKPIEQFVSGNLRIAKSRIFTSTVSGGLGLTEIKTFLTYQKCGWIKLVLKPDENWKQLIFLKSCGDIGNLREKWVLDHPILKGLGRVLYFLRRAFRWIVKTFVKQTYTKPPPSQ